MQKFKLSFFTLAALIASALVFHLGFRKTQAVNHYNTSAAQAQTGRASNITYRSSVDNVEMGAVLWTPGNFNPQGPKIPLFVYLHGGGGNGQVLASNAALTRELDARGWIGIAPDGRRWGLASKGCGWQTSAAYVDNPNPDVGPGERDMLDAIEWAKANYPIDLDRIYLSGFSMGGRGTYQIGLRNPDLFAAIAPLSPASDMYEIFVRRPEPAECKEGMTSGKPGDSLRVDTMYTITSGRFLLENAFNLPVFHGHGTQDTTAYNLPTPGQYQHGAHMLFDTSWNGCHGGTNLCFGHTPTLSDLRARHADGYDWAFMFSPVGHANDAKWIQGTPKSSEVTGTEDPQNPSNLIGMMEFLSRRKLQRSPDTVVYKSYTDVHRRAYWTEIDISLPWQDVPGAVRAKRNSANNILDAELSRVNTATFDLPLAGLRVAADAPLTINLKLLNEPVYDPALMATDVPLEPKIVLKGNFAGLNDITVLRDGAPLAASLIAKTATALTIGTLGIFAPTTLTIRTGSAPMPNVVASVSAASYKDGALASDSIVSAFGSNLATTTALATTLPLPTSLAGTTVRVSDSAGIERLASLFFASPTQLNYLLPPQTAMGQATVTVVHGGAISIGTIQVTRVAPGLFSASSDGKGFAAAALLRIKANGAQSYEPVVRFDQTQNKLVAVPIEFGVENDQLFLLLFGTGIRLRSSLSVVTAQIGGVNTEVLYAGEQGGFVGLDQINLRLPSSLKGRGEVDVVLTVDGQTANTVKVNFARQTQPTAFQCTQVIGFSQTNQWFTAGFENFVENNRWQLLWRSSSNIDLWADPNFVGWREPLVSPCAQGSTNPDRVVLTISGNRNSDPNWWAEQIRAVIGVIRSKYPAVRQIVLQPVVGGPNHSVCTFEGQSIRASENHPVIDQGIAKVVGGDVVAGSSPEVRTCADYRDQLGHLQSAANQALGELIGRFYVAFTPQ